MKTTTFFSTILTFLLPVLVQAQCINLSFQVSDFNGSQISCHGANDGAAFVNAVGANRFFTYQWSNGQTDAQAQNLTAGTYTVTVSDNTGCAVTGSVQINQPAAMTFTTQTVSTAYGYNLKCYGDSNGRLTSEAFGGTGKILYNWSNGNQTAFATGLSAGTYSISATDENGCLAVNNVTLTQPTAVTATATVISLPSTAGAADAEAIAQANGGSGAYTFEWSNGELSNELYNVTAGTYTVKAIDALGCSDMAVIEIVNPLNNGISTAQGNNNGTRNSGNSNISLTNQRQRPVMPQLVTPNTAGYNSNFTIKNIENVENADLTIFNMMGQQLASYKNYSNEWNGVNANNEELTNGTYVAVLKYTVDGVTEVMTTQVVVAR
jgi:gliding motility-associated-like protein